MHNSRLLLLLLLLQDVYPVAVYVVRNCPEMKAVLSRANASPSAAFDLSALWAGTATQLSIQASAPKQIRNPRLPTLWAKLVGFGLEEQVQQYNCTYLL